MIRLDDGPHGRPAVFKAPLRLIRADTAPEVGPALDQLDQALAQGHWVAGFLSYEAGYALEDRLTPLMPEARNLPLVLFGVFAAPRDPMPEDDGAGPVTLTPPRPLHDAATHGAAVDRALRYIRDGDCYQVNLTFPFDAEATGDAKALRKALAQVQPVHHGAYVELPGAPRIVSLSPELFFRTDADGAIATHPMKGTRPRDDDPQRDEALRRELHDSVKDRAENLMIVDLMRNDISRFCQTGSVRVPELFKVESYATVHQMVSRVTGQMRDGTGLATILRALFPCGSITGAPKIRAMEIIAELEGAARDIYCGSIGWAAPDGSASFNVAIRTLTLFDDGRVRLNAGGGIVADSTPEAEYQEALWKARFARVR